jgi:3-deoxy-D-arabino-heptulosonate 7-phosphate (DAHP) synthase class II
MIVHTLWCGGRVVTEDARHVAARIRVKPPIAYNPVPSAPALEHRDMFDPDDEPPL